MEGTLGAPSPHKLRWAAEAWGERELELAWLGPSRGESWFCAPLPATLGCAWEEPDSSALHQALFSRNWVTHQGIGQHLVRPTKARLPADPDPPISTPKGGISVNPRVAVSCVLEERGGWCTSRTLHRGNRPSLLCGRSGAT